MPSKKLLAIAVAGVLSALAAPMATSAAIDNRAAVAFAADPMLALERNRVSIVERLVAEYRSELAGNRIDEAAFRTALSSLRIDQLLAASLSNSLQDVTAIVAAPTSESAALSRYVAVAPTSSLASMPAADAYLVRSGEGLSVVKAAQLQLNADTQLVGYFAAAPTSVVIGGIQQKDGPGSGANSWIGYTAGSNVASGTGSAVAAGTFNAATNTNAAVFAGQSNLASGISSLVVGGFDNQATVIDATIVAGAGNRAGGQRSVIVGGGYNLATGQFAAIVGGGRQTGSGAAGTQTQDNVASGNWSFIGGGLGNTASGPQSFVGGGQLNTASGQWSSVPGGLNNTAANNGTVAMGRNANATNFGTFVFADGNAAYSDNGAYTFNIQAANGVHLSPSTAALDFGSQTRQMIRLWGGANAYGIGIQGGTQYYRVDSGTGNGSGFAWYEGGVHSDVGFDPGTGGNRLMSLSRDGQLTLPFNTVQQAIQFNSASKALGAQAFMVYARAPTSGGFGIYRSGVHTYNEADPGAGGEVLAGFFKTGDGALLQTATVTGTLRVVNVVATSDRESKTSFAAVAPKAILAKVASMPISTWVYKNEGADAPRHIGPVAQDFAAAFGVGQDDKTISVVDASGVALAAIKGLHEELRDRDARIALQDVQIETQAARLSSQQLRIAALEEQLGQVAATQLQWQDLAATVTKLQQELASLRPAREVASAAH